MKLQLQIVSSGHVPVNTESTMFRLGDGLKETKAFEAEHLRTAPEDGTGIRTVSNGAIPAPEEVFSSSEQQDRERRR